MRSYEDQYLDIMERILNEGDVRNTRNAVVKSIFRPSIEIDMENEKYSSIENGVYSGKVPIVTSRKIFYKGVLGEIAAFLRGPNDVKDFEKFGCNYWNLWSREDGSMNLSYGNDWINWNSATREGTNINQVQNVINSISKDPYSRRHIITGWNPQAIHDGLSLPCCHTFYQWYVRGDYLDFMFYQRSADWAIGVPSNIVLAYIFNVIMSYHTGYRPGKVYMDFGDAHLYKDHWETAKEHINRKPLSPATYRFNPKDEDTLFDFIPENITISDYKYLSKLKYKLYK